MAQHCFPFANKTEYVRFYALFNKLGFSTLRGQTVLLGNESVFRNKDFLFVLLSLSHCSDKNFTCLKTCLWNPRTCRHKTVRLSSAQFDLVLRKKTNI